MRLTWKGGVTTLLTAFVAALYVAFLAGADLPPVSGPRALAAITGNEIALAVLVGSIVVLWLASTIRHAFAGTGQAGISDRDLHRLIEHDTRTRC